MNKTESSKKDLNSKILNLIKLIVQSGMFVFIYCKILILLVRTADVHSVCFLVTQHFDN